MSGQGDRLCRKEAAGYLASLGYPIAHRNSANLAIKGKGPPYTRFGWRIVTYDRADLERWAQSQKVCVKGDLG